jgi:hypothetical protein
VPRAGDQHSVCALLQENLEALLIGAMNINERELLVPFLMWSPAKPALAARLAANAVYVYNGSDMTLLGKKPIALEGVQDAKWSPSQNLLAVFQVCTHACTVALTTLLTMRLTALLTAALALANAAAAHTHLRHAVQQGIAQQSRSASSPACVCAAGTSTRARTSSNSMPTFAAGASTRACVSGNSALQEEHNNMPARVAIYSLPDKVEIRAKSLFMVHEVHLYWHEQSKYLAVHVRSQPSCIPCMHAPWTLQRSCSWTRHALCRAQAALRKRCATLAAWQHALCAPRHAFYAPRHALREGAAAARPRPPPGWLALSQCCCAPRQPQCCAAVLGTVLL